MPQEQSQQPQFETFTWSGVTRYRCPYCLYDSGDPLNVKIHLQERHVDHLLRIQEEQKQISTQLFDGDGKLITEKPGDPALAGLIDKTLKGE